MKNVTFINAGAGSGKTYTLTQLLEHNIHEGIPANAFMLTTFSKAAAAEIRERAVATLFESGKYEDAILLQGAYIGTVHSVAMQFIRRFWYVLGISPEIKELSTEDEDYFFSQAISSIPSIDDLSGISKLSNRFAFQSFEESIIPKADPDAWKKHVLSIIKEARANDIDDLSLTSESYLSSIELFKSLYPISSGSEIDSEPHQIIIDVINAIYPRIRYNAEIGTKKYADILEELDKFISSFEWSHFPNLQGIIGGIAAKVVPNNEKEDLLERLEYFHELKQFHQDHSNYLSLIFKIAHECLLAYSSYKAENSFIDFADMESHFLHLMEHEMVQLDIKDSIKVVMVDEFQDCNPMQLAIFSKLSILVNQSYWVGDPKQCIYQFRGSSPEIVSQVLQCFENGAAEQLNTGVLKASRRSRNGLVNFANDLFAPILAPQLYPIRLKKGDVMGRAGTPVVEKWISDSFGGENEIVLSPEESVGLLAHRNDIQEGFDSLSESPLIHFHVKHTKSSKAEHFASAVPKMIYELLNSNRKVFDTKLELMRPIKPGDIAILCLTNSKISILAEELTNSGFTVAAESSLINDTAEYRLLTSSLKYIASSHNSLALAEIMLLVDGGLSNISNLRELIEARLRASSDSNATKVFGQDHAFVKLLHELKSFRHLPVSELVKKLILHGQFNRFVAAWGNAGTRRENLLKLIGVSLEYESYCEKMNSAASITGFLKYLEVNSKKIKESSQTGENAIVLRTYHGSKGLEWPVVVLFDLDKDKSFSVPKVYGIRSQYNTKGFEPTNPLNNRYISHSFWPVGTKKGLGHLDANILSSKVALDEKDRMQKELHRILYVGVTRARDYLVTTSFNNKIVDNSFLSVCVKAGNSTYTFKTQLDKSVSKSTIDVFQTKHLSQLNIINLEDFEPVEIEKTSIEDQYFKQDKLEAIPYLPFILNPSKLEGRQILPEIIFRRNNRIPISFPKNHELEEKRLGDALHAILFLENLNEEIVTSVLNRHLPDFTINALDVISAINDFRSFLSSKYSIVHTHRELPLEDKLLNNQMIVGSADLVLETPEGFVLIDYKSYPGKIDHVLDIESTAYAGKYSGQLQAYADAILSGTGKKVLAKYLLYIVLGVLVEIKNK